MSSDIALDEVGYSPNLSQGDSLRKDKPRLLDLFCGAGGAAMGYHRAGFEVVGVDINPQPHYPFRFIQADALRLMFGDWCFDAIHASPPCQAFTQISARWRGKGTKADEHPDCLTPTLELLRQMTIPWVVENVVGARRMMNANLTLHGGMFGLGVHRPRLFESNILLLAPRANATAGAVGVYDRAPSKRKRYRNNGNYKGKSEIRMADSVECAQEVMGIDWMPEWRELCEAIPPAYTELIGHQLLSHIHSRCEEGAFSE